MTKEETTPEVDEVVEETTTPNPEEEVVVTEEESSDSTSEPSKPDYEAIIEDEGKKPKPLKAQEAYLERKAKREEEEEVKEDAPLTLADLNKIRAEDKAEYRREFQGERALELARGMSESDNEANAIIARWGNRVFPEGMGLQEQIEEMHASVNRKVLVSKNKELMRALKAKGNESKDTATTYRDDTKGTEPKLAADVKSQLKGYAYNTATKMFEKRIGGEKSKKFIVFDPKLKKIKGIINK